MVILGLTGGILGVDGHILGCDPPILDFNRFIQKFTISKQFERGNPLLFNERNTLIIKNRFMKKGMNQMQVLVLRFDYKLSTKLEQDQRNLAGAALRGKETLIPPHMSLFTFEQVHPGILGEIIKPWSERQKQLLISLTSLGFFKQKGTFFAAPVITKEIVEFHTDLYNLIADLHTTEISPYLPGKWVPHATLLNNTALNMWGPLFQRAALAFEPMEGKAVALECWTIVNGRAQTEWTHFLS